MKIQSIRGVRDILPEQIKYWHLLEDKLWELAHSYDFSEIRLPLIEYAELFSRSVGEMTDIVEKEMYSFLDQSDKYITLRPEGTASCVRAAIENNLLRAPGLRLFYFGPMFRRERPQRGRYRQFYQCGFEVFGYYNVEVELELLLLSSRLWKDLGLSHGLELQINTIGSLEARKKYQIDLIDYFSQYKDLLAENALSRLYSNPLRILDSKDNKIRELIVNAPIIHDYLSIEDKIHFSNLQDYLAGFNIDYVVNPSLVRGLDYYNRTVFEWVSNDLGAQGTVCAGGRYDGLVAHLGGPSVPAVGFAIGIDRVIELLIAKGEELIPDCSVQVIACDDKSRSKIWHIIERLRFACPDFRVIGYSGEGNLTKQLRKANQNKVDWVILLGEKELTDNKFTMKCLSQEIEQGFYSWEELINVLNLYASEVSK